MIRKVTNSAMIGGWIAMFASRALFGKTLLRDEIGRRRYFIEGTSHYSRKGLNRLGIEVRTEGLDQRFRRNNFLLVSNHMSYVDIMVLASVLPSVFVTSIDMGEAFFLGDMAEMGGSLFIERRNRTRVDADIEQMAKALRQGFHVSLYPEGTSTDGEKVLPFKKSLLMAAVAARRDIVPVCLKYTHINGEAFPAQRDRICWYGDTTFPTHFKGLMGVRSAVAELRFLETIPVREDSTRDGLASLCYNAVANAYTRPTEAPALTERLG